MDFSKFFKSNIPWWRRRTLLVKNRNSLKFLTIATTAIYILGFHSPTPSFSSPALTDPQTTLLIIDILNSTAMNSDPSNSSTDNSVNAEDLNCPTNDSQSILSDSQRFPSASPTNRWHSVSSDSHVTPSTLPTNDSQSVQPDSQSSLDISLTNSSQTISSDLEITPSPSPTNYSQSISYDSRIFTYTLPTNGSHSIPFDLKTTPCIYPMNSSQFILSDSHRSSSASPTNNSLSVSSDSHVSPSTSPTNDSQPIKSDAQTTPCIWPTNGSQPILFNLKTTPSTSLTNYSQSVSYDSRIFTYTLSPENSQSITSDSQSITSDSQPITSDSQSITSDSQSITSDSLSVTSDSQSVTSDSQSNTSDSLTYLPTLQPVNPSNVSFESYTLPEECLTNDSQPIFKDSQTFPSASSSSIPETILSDSRTSSSPSQTTLWQTLSPDSYTSSSDLQTNDSRTALSDLSSSTSNDVMSSQSIPSEGESSSSASKDVTYSQGIPSEEESSSSASKDVTPIQSISSEGDSSSASKDVTSSQGIPSEEESSSSASKDVTSSQGIPSEEGSSSSASKDVTPSQDIPFEGESSSSTSMEDVSQSGQASGDGGLCRTGGCIATADILTQNMDTKVEPCDNFYQYACGSFAKSAEIPKTEGVSSTFHSAANRILRIVQKIFNQTTTKDEKPYKLVKDYYKACSKGDKDLTPIKDVLKKLGGWPVLEENWSETSFTWNNTIYQFRNIGFDDAYFLTLSQTDDPRNSSAKIITIDQMRYSIHRALLVSKTSTSQKEAYFKYMIEVAVLFGAERDRATKELKESFEFEIQLANYDNPSTNAEHAVTQPSDEYPPKISTLEKDFPTIPWTEYINSILAPFVSVQNTNAVLVKNYPYINNLSQLLKTTPKKVLANYLFWRAVHSSIRYLTEDVRKQRLAYETVLYGITETKPRWKICFGIIFDNLSFIVGYLYNEKNVPPEDAAAAQEMVVTIHNETLKILNSTAWMDESSKKKTEERIDSLKNLLIKDIENLTSSSLDFQFLVDYYSELRVDSNQFFMSHLNVSKFTVDKTYAMFKPPRCKQDHEKIAFINLGADPNEYHNREINNILDFTTIFQTPFFSADRPHYLNYAQLGIIIGRLFATEIQNGAVIGYWSSEMKEKFSQKVQCFVDHYNNYKIEGFDKKVNGTAIKESIIATYTSIQITYNAFFQSYVDTYGQEQKIPGFEKYTHPQMFWITVANLFCTKFRPETLKTTVEAMSNKHIPAEALVVGLISNVVDFSCDFNCTGNAKMNLPNKCHLWG